MEVSTLWYNHGSMQWQVVDRRSKRLISRIKNSYMTWDPKIVFLDFWNLHIETHLLILRQGSKVKNCQRYLIFLKSRMSILKILKLKIERRYAIMKKYREIWIYKILKIMLMNHCATIRPFENKKNFLNCIFVNFWRLF